MNQKFPSSICPKNVAKNHNAVCCGVYSNATTWSTTLENCKMIRKHGIVKIVYVSLMFLYVCTHNHKVT